MVIVITEDRDPNDLFFIRSLTTVFEIRFVLISSLFDNASTVTKNKVRKKGCIKNKMK